MKTNPFRLFIVLALAASSNFGIIQVTNANPAQPKNNAATPETGASLLGQPQIQGTSTALNTPNRELPTFEIKRTQRSKGILDVLGGRFVDEDRHPSFRNSTLPKK